MALYLVLSNELAAGLRGLTSIGAALQPQPIKTGDWILPLAVLTDPAHQLGNIAAGLAAAPQIDVPDTSLYAVGDTIPAQALSALPYVGKVPTLKTNPLSSLSAIEQFNKWTVVKPSVLTLGGPGSFNSNGCNGPTAVYFKGKYYVYFVGLNASNVNSIALATGTDPRNLTVQGVVVQGTPATWDSAYVSGPRLFADPNSTKWYLYYFGSNAPGFEQPPASIGYLISDNPDGPWMKGPGPILAPGAPGAWDDNILYRPFALYENPLYYLFFNARKTAGLNERIGYATGNSPIGPFNKYSGNPVLSINGGLEADRIGDPVVIKPNSGLAEWLMFFYGSPGVPPGFSFSARSSDLSAWARFAGNPMAVTGITYPVRMCPFLGPNGWESYCDDGANNIYYMTAG